MPSRTTVDNGPTSRLLYTFQLTPASERFSGMVRQLYTFFGMNVGVSTSGPPARPAGSIVPLIQYNRFGSVGPSTEQW